MDLNRLHFSSLPESIILYIFTLLDIHSLARAAKVNKQWKRISYDRFLWTSVYLDDCKLSKRKLWKLIRARFDENLKVLHIKPSLKSEKEVVSDAIFHHLNSVSPGLQQLDLLHCDLKSLRAIQLPRTLVSLDLAHSALPANWFSQLSKENFLPLLEELNLSNCSRIDNKELCNIARIKSLRQLNLSHCYRITNSGIQILCENLKDLSEFKIGGCPRVSEIALASINRYLKKLRTLDVSNCNRISDRGLNLIIGMKTIRCVDISHIKTVTETTILNLCRAIPLTNLTVINCGLSSECIQTANCYLPENSQIINR
ncbi:F-box/LRR-repeat protein 12 [Trichoplax sp. H2]|uniref:F-box domain-containing protein n=1 Tax=Trichoplax adhaerens TaxID=10228 RepID=B3RYZ4_TRIAD|nr:hypothetical protein TRIADDRAFT_57270 [Trichoplax adhaerens]EDV24112.1 hypothetical protein TRIADDRAFT_57270 [Trichoplax adhaerens]RDD40740.1 F-box/LRR-repeat protein 12 [Trichoplax sp. H2]|eukprot:XP_002113638.1 hypothetical protein TRIADDRAFT_57270 [Trichoplax adhaerens]